MQQTNTTSNRTPSSCHMKLPSQTASLKTVDKALRVLDFLAVFGGQVGVRELDKFLDVNKSSTHRLLTTLESHGYVAKEPHTGKYQMGLRVFELGAVVLNQADLRAVARPYLQRLATSTGEVVHLVVGNRGQCLYIDKLTGDHAIRTGSALGCRRLVLHMGRQNATGAPPPTEYP